MSFLYSLNEHSSLSIVNGQGDILFTHEYLESSQKNFSIDEVMKSDNFIKIKENLAPAKLGVSYWHRFKVKNDSTQFKELTLFLDNYVVTEIDINVIRNGILSETLKRGSSRWPTELEQRALPSYSFSLGAKDAITFYIRTKSKGSASLPISIFYRSDFNDYKHYIFLLWGAMVGLVFIMSFYNLILYFGERDIVYLYYVGYILTVLAEIGLLHGYIVFILPSGVVDIFTEYITAVHYFILVFGLMFALKYLKIDQDKNNLYSIGCWFSLSMVPIALTSLLIEEHIAVQIYFTLQGFTYGFITYLLALKYKENFSWAKYYFISWLPIYIAGVITPMFFLGMIEYNFWTRNALLIAIMVEAGLISMGLASRLRSKEQKIIYQMSHEQTLLLANSSLMTKVIKEHILRSDKPFEYGILVLEIINFHGFSPYLTPAQIRALNHRIIKLIQDEVGKNLLINIDNSTHDSSTAFYVKEGFIGFCFKGHDAKKVNCLVSNLEERLPLTYDTKTMSVEVGCVFGIALSNDARHPAQVTNKALQVIATAKKGVGICAQYTEMLIKDEQRKITLAAGLKKAITDNTLQLYHQPQICLKSNRIIGSEALLRWKHPEMGFISPDEFIQVAEDTGIIDKLTQWVITQAFTHHIETTKINIHFTTAINISVLDLVNTRLCQWVINLANTRQVKKETIILEITETAGVEDVQKFKRNLQRLADAGFKIAIDDYGTGYSSLNYLSENPIYELKIDKSLIAELAYSEKNELIVKATITMAKSLGIKVVAEGIENLAVADKLLTFECDIAQGYYYGKPMPFNDFLVHTESVKRSRTLLL